MATNLIFNKSSKKTSQITALSLWLWAVFILISAGSGFWMIRVVHSFQPDVSQVIKISLDEDNINPIAIPEPPKKRFQPGIFSMDTIKNKGCVVDGMLSGYGGNTKQLIKLVNRSNCQYIHRAMETWLDDPNFEKAADIMAQIEKPGMVFGMFIAEAVDRKTDYVVPETGEKLDFDDMCRKGTKNDWGEHTCKPNIERKEYKKYITSITQRAMDIGIQSFLFGQVHYQDWESYSKSDFPEIIETMRNYAKSKGLKIIIGAQTNDVTDQSYLQLFDYIEGGVGIDMRGNIENGPCWSGKQSCWALLWNKQYSSKAKNVILHLDWSGIETDDLSKFARMDQATRGATLKKLYEFFTGKNMGFMLPMQAPIWPDNPGCHGPKKRFYSADNKYTCKDEDVINQILSGK